MKTTSKITLLFSICISSCTPSLCEILGGYLFEKIADCVVFNECPQPRNQERARCPFHNPSYHNNE